MMLKHEKFLTLFIGIGAIGGAVMMWIDPTGVAWGGGFSAISNLYFVFGLIEAVAAVVCLTIKHYRSRLKV